MQISVGPDPTALSSTSEPEARRARPGARQVLLPVVVGVVLGPLDLLLQRVLPYPFANLANSPAVWGLVAFALGWTVRSRPRWWPAVAGTVALLLAVETYYLAAVIALGDDVSTLTDGAARLWLALAVGAGVVLGTAGAWARSDHAWRGPVGTAAIVGVFLGEAVLDLSRAAQAAGDAAYRVDQTQTAVVLVVVAVVLTAVAARSARQRVVGAALAVGVAAAGALVLGVL